MTENSSPSIEAAVAHAKTVGEEVEVKTEAPEAQPEGQAPAESAPQPETPTA